MTTDLKLPGLPEPLSCDIQFGSRQGTLLYHTADQMRARDRQIVELCARVLDQMAAEDNTSNYYVIAARRVRALKTEEVHLTARSGLPPETEQEQPDSVHLTAPGPMEASTTHAATKITGE